MSGGERQWVGRDVHLRGIAVRGGMTNARIRAKQAAANCDPLVRRLIEIVVRDMAGDMVAYTKRVGISREALSRWRRGDRDPKLSLFRAAVEAAGYDLVIVSRRRKGGGDEREGC